MLDSLSREDIAKLEQTTSKIDELTSRQEEIINKVLEGEQAIGTRRMSYLKQYFDAYSAGLDDIITRKTSKLNDAFLFLERQVNESLAATDTEIKKRQAAANEAANNRTRSAASDIPSSPSQPPTPPSGPPDNPPNPPGPPNNPPEPPEGPLPPLPPNADGGDDVEVFQSSPDVDKAQLDSALMAKLGKDFTDDMAIFVQKSAEERKAIIENADEEALKNLKAPILQKAELENRHREQELEDLRRQAELKRTILNDLMDLELSRSQSEEDLLNRSTELRLTKMQEVIKAEANAQDFINKVETERLYAEQNAVEIAENQQRQEKAKNDEKSAQTLEEQRIKYLAKQELELKRKNNRELTAEEKANLLKQANEKYKLDQKNLDKITAERLKREEKEQKRKEFAAERAELRNETNSIFHAETFEERKNAFYNLTRNEEGEVDKESVGKTISAAMYALSDIAKQLEKKIDNIASFKGFIDTRLQGSSNEQYAGSYWDQLVRDMTEVGAFTPFYKQENFANNIKTLVDRGIAFDLKQRAFLMTIQEKIADTFDVANGTLLRLVRIQQEDSSAGRLGMESALNSFLNSMYENTEYLRSVAEGVRASLEEMESLMQGAEATEVEYQVQKWLGSLYSVGMSQNAVNSISTSLGQIAAGQIEGLINGGAGNLLVMAANEANLSIADILTNGLDSSKTNKLLEAAVNYLAELAESSDDNQVVQQQLANVFGVKASDLKAATNLTVQNSVSSIYEETKTYNDMLSQLYMMADSMGSRTSRAEKLTNLWDNGQYSLAGSMASNPVSYFIYKMASLLDSAAGGIDLPFVNVMGFGVDLNTTVSDLMRVAAVGTGILGSIGPLISSLGSSFSGQAMLNKLGFSAESGLEITPRGSSGSLAALSGGGSTSTSESGYVNYAGNTSGSDVKDATIQEAKDTKDQLMIEAKEEAEANQLDIINTTIVKIYELLDDVSHGNSYFRVRVDDYGLTKASNNGSLGGVAALGGSGGSGSLGSTTTGSGLSSGLLGGGLSANGVSMSATTDGWTGVIR